jgi:hypothetical protein
MALTPSGQREVMEMNTTTNTAVESNMGLAVPAREPNRERRRIGIVWARGACRQGLGLEILHDLLRTRGVRRAAFSCDKHDVLLVDYDARFINAVAILNAVCRPGVWARFTGG